MFVIMNARSLYKNVKSTWKTSTSQGAGADVYYRKRGGYGFLAPVTAQVPDWQTARASGAQLMSTPIMAMQAVSAAAQLWARAVR